MSEIPSVRWKHAECVSLTLNSSHITVLRVNMVNDECRHGWRQAVCRNYFNGV